MEIKISNELKKRIITGSVGIAILLLLLVFGGATGTALFAAVISLGAIYEFSEMFFSLSDKKEKRSLMLGTAWLVAFFNYWIPRAEYEFLMIIFLGYAVYFMITAPRFLNTAQFSVHSQEWMGATFGQIYFGFLPLYLVLIRVSNNGLQWVLLYLFMNWAGDSAAYFVGKKYGKRKLYPAISPKKSVEGGLAGLVGCFIVALIAKFTFFSALAWSAVIFVPFLIGFVTQIGDFCESYLKRAFGVKDSGSILPGHGGFMDRFDGVIFGLPIMYACVRLF